MAPDCRNQPIVGSLSIVLLFATIKKNSEKGKDT